MADLFKNKLTMELETKNFNAHVKDFMRGSSLGTDVILRKFAFDLIKRIVVKTPVDTGRARAGWYPALEGLGGIAPRTMPKRYASHASEWEGYQKGSIEFNLGQSQTYKWIEMVNGVDYIIYLEYGWSKQAPAGMCRISMMELRRALPEEMKVTTQKKWNEFYWRF